MRICLILIYMFLLLFLGGCATLNESECRNADWRIIGLEDGVNGKLISYIGNHRTACAEHDIVPDLDAYQQGHGEGVRRYCTNAKGFEVGKKGGEYNGVCPPDLEDLFLDAYDYGFKIHSAQHKIKKISAMIDSKQKKIDEVKKEIKEKQHLMVSDKATEVERLNLLAELKDLHEKIGGLLVEIVEKEKRKAVVKVRIKKLNSYNPY